MSPFTSKESPLAVTFISLGRFHVADLARELAKLDCKVTFISDVPKSRLNKFGLKNCRTVTVWPSTFLTVLGRWLAKAPLNLNYDFSVLQSFFLEISAALLSPRCDVVIGMSGIVLHAGKFLRWRFGAKFWLERGSQHILAQEQIVRSFSTANFKMSRRTISRELRGYACADKVVIPSQHVRRSFEDRGFPSENLVGIPYGVDLSMFQWSLVPEELPPTVIMVGTWSLRKGCDRLTEACTRLPEVRFLHVGSVSDLKLPDNAPNFVHVDSVDQNCLAQWYRRAHLMVLPSREEGMATVLSQALASGLFVVASDRTGAEDLKLLLQDEERICVVPQDDFPKLLSSIQTLLPIAYSKRSQQPPWLAQIGRLSWNRYAVDYFEALKRNVEGF